MSTRVQMLCLLFLFFFVFIFVVVLVVSSFILLLLSSFLLTNVILYFRDLLLKGVLKYGDLMYEGCWDYSVENVLGSGFGTITNNKVGASGENKAWNFVIDRNDGM